ncbi:hypothetical protein WICPIJ_004178 [Wickerhamomyces pijperi]|uniref:Zn(2)-C6 fungal-type domain-containing protein n=1 Tax=Wickerhamomyces pijperi TaxID=599730 RepID=A0A9P8Q855_WICPI|nr:hypothetical protein WICPIJ_004178 [Wickerhamomyces pijperi]
MLVTFSSKADKDQKAQQASRNNQQGSSAQTNNTDISASSSSASLQTTAFDGSIHRKKKPSSGCITCKIRKKRCSEERPVCADCKRLGKHCVWISEGMDSKEIKEIRKRVREEEEKHKTVRGQSKKKSESPQSHPAQNEPSDMFPSGVEASLSYNGNLAQQPQLQTQPQPPQSTDQMLRRKQPAEQQEQEEFSSLDTENYDSQLNYYNRPSKSQQREQSQATEVTEITDFSFTPFINNDFNESTSNPFQFQPFKSNYLNNLFQPLSPNTLTLLGSHETLSSLNTHSNSSNNNNNNNSSNLAGNSNTQDSHNNVFQFSNLFESNIRSDLSAPLDEELKKLDVPAKMSIADFQADFYADGTHNTAKAPAPPTSQFPPGVTLNETGIKLFNHYKNNLSSVVSIVPKESNYYKNIFLPMAAVNKGTLYAILAWSGYHLGGEYVAEGDQYMELALDFLQESSPRQSPQDGALLVNDNENELTLQKLASLLIMCAAEICKGDVKKWPVLLQWCSKIISKRGGLDAFRTNDKQANWIISNFIYHDILASSLNERSTHFPIEVYNKFLKNNKFFDPLQGILKPVFHLMSEVSKMSFHRASDLDQIKDLENRIENCEPDEGDLSNFNNDDRKVQLKLFKTFKLTSILYLRQSLLRINASSLETQILVTQLLDNLSIVLNSSVESSLCFPMFIAGINCVNENYRMIIMVHFDQLIKRYNFKNLERIKFLVKTIWERNENGERFVDWFKIVKDLNWDVSFA